uniref:39S ribosomal protein L48, mitochondrial-like n=1 Tax=Ciona intestinalis TaxID=7719 RepID=F7BLF3_CIOIN|nr:39S ribosomal protein L48, mitochondrial-like [Ciona intestinalis]|eukprot:XP_002128890.1 39S ribosomal protein L48, mitochondrial-like [Ciona intestinalis]
MAARNIVTCVLNSQRSLCNICCYTPIVTRRTYRNRPSHNIGRVHGLVIKDKPIETKGLGVWKPKDIEASKPTNFNTLNFVVSGYDMVLVENFATYVHRLMIKFKQNVTETYAIPTTSTSVKKMGKNASADVEQMDTDIVLNNHQRVVQVKDLPSTLAPMLLQQLMHTVPQSVSFSVKQYTEEDLNMRYQQRIEIEREKAELQALLDSR